MWVFEVEWQVLGEDDLRGPYYVTAPTAEAAIDKWEEDYECKDDETGRVTYACATSKSNVLFASRLYRVE